MTESPSEFSDVVERNAAFAAAFDDRGAAKVPARQLVVVTCMDARVDAWRALGLGPGDAHVLRNAGGRVSADVERSVAVSAAALGTRRVAVVHHTDCGMLGPEDGIRDAVATRTGRAVPAGTRFLAFDDAEESVREDVRLLRESPLVPDDVALAGFLYDVGTGLLAAVEGA